MWAWKYNIVLVLSHRFDLTSPWWFLSYFFRQASHTLRIETAVKFFSPQHWGSGICLLIGAAIAWFNFSMSWWLDFTGQKQCNFNEFNKKNMSCNFSFAAPVRPLIWPWTDLTRILRCTRWSKRIKRPVSHLDSPTPLKCCKRSWKRMREVSQNIHK